MLVPLTRDYIAVEEARLPDWKRNSSIAWWRARSRRWRNDESPDAARPGLEAINGGPLTGPSGSLSFRQALA